MLTHNGSTLQLEADEIHVWQANLDLPKKWLTHFASTLSVDELQRSERLVFTVDRHRFISARGILRSIIADYLAANPSQVRFSYNEYGKPALTEINAEKMLCFNVSHSGNRALFVFSIGRELGVDIEKISKDERLLDIVEIYFAPGEIASLRALPKELQYQGFFNCWTRKEAFIKARGMGLSIALDSFEVSLAPGDKPLLLSSRGPLAILDWKVRSLNVGVCYTAALVFSGDCARLRNLDWNSIRGSDDAPAGVSSEMMRNGSDFITTTEPL
jgi:4'-phosphopantetheinyl transferase